MVRLWGQTALSRSAGVITSPLLSVIGMGLWTWSLIPPCPKNTSVALPKAILVQGDVSVKISSLWREDVFFCGQSWSGEPKSRHDLSTVHSVSGLTLGWKESKVDTGTRGGCLQATTPLKPARTEAWRAPSWSEWQAGVWAENSLTATAAGVALRSSGGRVEYIHFSCQWVKHAGCFKTRKT